VILSIVNSILIINQACINFLFFYIFFFFNIIFNFLIFFFYFFFFFDLYFSMDIHIISLTYGYITPKDTLSSTQICFFYFLFFLFVLFFFNYIYLFSIKSIFSVVCDTTTTLDIALALTGMKTLTIFYFNIFYIFKITYLMNLHYKNFYFYLNFFNFFILILFSLISIFFLINNLNLRNYNLIKGIVLKTTKQNKFFFKLENVVLLTVFKFFKNEVIKHVQLLLITFLINFFSYFVKDLTYLNSVSHFFFAELFFTLHTFKNSDNLSNVIKTQLIYIKHI